MNRYLILGSLFLFSALNASNTENRPSSLELNALTITAQKEETILQETPISISVLTATEIEDRNLQSIKEAASYVPSLLLFDLGGTGTLQPSMRGLGTDSSIGSPTVGLYVDGIPYSSTAGMDAPLQDVERIEVLRGPQGSLYGKYAESGVINIITQEPTNETRINLNSQLGSDNLRSLSLNVSGALIEDRLFAGVSMRHYEKEGFMENTYLNKNYNDREQQYGKLHLRYQPMENLSFSLISSKLKRRDGAFAMNLMGAQDILKVASDIENFDHSDVEMHAFKIKYDHQPYRFESITSHKKDRYRRNVDYDASPLHLFHASQDTTTRMLSQEFRVSSKEADQNWLLGFSAERGGEEGGSYISSILPGMSSYHPASTKGDAIGLFGQITQPVIENFDLILGFRWDRDNKSIDIPTLNDKKTYEAFSPKVALQYQPNEQNSLYLSASKGYRSGGFYASAAPGYSKNFDKETLWNYEIGHKATLFDQRLMLNSSVYYMDIDKMQVLSAVNAALGYISNAASATSKGVEIEVAWRFLEALTFRSGMGYNRTTFDEFKDAQGDYKGNQNPFAPKWSYSAGIEYRNLHGFYARVDYTGYSRMHLDKANQYEAKGYGLVHGKIGYERESFDLYLYAKNLLDKEHHTYGWFGGQYSFASEPREIGLQIAYRF